VQTSLHRLLNWQIPDVVNKNKDQGKENTDTEDKQESLAGTER